MYHQLAHASRCFSCFLSVIARKSALAVVVRKKGEGLLDALCDCRCHLSSSASNACVPVRATVAGEGVAAGTIVVAAITAEGSAVAAAIGTVTADGMATTAAVIVRAAAAMMTRVVTDALADNTRACYA